MSAVEIDRDALGMADLAFMQSPGPTMAARVRDAITAYVFAVSMAIEKDGFRIYPSGQQVQAAVDQARRQCKGDEPH